MKKRIIATIIILCVVFGFVFACHKITYTYSGELYKEDYSRTVELKVVYPRYCEWFGHNKSASLIMIDGAKQYFMLGKGYDSEKYFFVDSLKFDDLENGYIFFSKDYSEVYFEVGDVKFIAASDEFVKLVEN